jgi:hypothetical protein
MSLLPGYFKARKRDDDLAAEPPPDHEARDDVFNLIPQRTAEDEEALRRVQTLRDTQALRDELASRDAPTYDGPITLPDDDPPARPKNTEAEEPPAGRNVHAVGAMDLSRLSIDNDGRLYWDGKPVEVRRRIMMSRRQIIAASVIGAFVIVGAIGSVIQGTAAAHDLACRWGWTECPPLDVKPLLPPPAPPARTDIPA